MTCFASARQQVRAQRLPADPEPVDQRHLRRPAGRGMASDRTAMQPTRDREVPPREGATSAGKRLRPSYELRLGCKRGAGSLGVAQVTVDGPAGEVEGGTTDGRIDGE
jgi:hypothetical protein